MKRSLLIIFAFTVLTAPAGAGESIVRESRSGPITAEVRLEPAKPLIGDTVTLTITVQAQKDVELLMPAFGEALERYTIVDFVPRETIDDEGAMIAVQKYRLQPPSSGSQAIPPILIADHEAGCRKTFSSPSSLLIGLRQDHRGRSA